MSKNLPAMIYSAPIKEDVVDLDFGGLEINGIKAKRKIRAKKEEPNTVYSQWHALPDIILEDIFSRLSIKERYYASQVCRNWNRIFYSPRVWNTFILGDRTLTRRKFNYYMGDQHVLDHYRAQTCLHRMGRGFRKIIITPMENFFNLYEFMTIVSYFCEYFEDQPLNLVRTLDFTFGCEYSIENGDSDDKIFGTGGRLLQALKRMMANLTGLRHLSLQDLLLEKEDAKYLLDDVAYSCCESLQTLRIVNCSKEPYALLHTAVFVNLHTLTISPQHLGEDVIYLLSFTQLKDLFLIQTKYTEYAPPVSYKVWKDCAYKIPYLRVHHLMEGKTKIPIIFQEGAPVRSIVYNSPHCQVPLQNLLTISALYHNSLEVYAQLGLPRYYLPKNFEERIDSFLILLSRSCLNLHTVVIQERISTATVLLLAYTSRNLCRLIVRSNALIKKCEWPRSPEWTDSFYEWLKITSRSYEATETEVSRMLNHRWAPLSDKAFKNYKI